jgi:hypothetical protein
MTSSTELIVFLIFSLTALIALGEIVLISKRADAAHRGATMMQQPARFLTPHTEQVRRDSNVIQIYPTASSLVGQREGRLSESSPAFRGRAAQADCLDVQGERLSHAYSTSMQTGIHTSPGLFSSVVAGSHGEERPRSFLPARASLKLAKLAQAMLDVFAGSFWLFYVALWIVVILGILPFTVFCLLLVKF